MHQKIRNSLLRVVAVFLAFLILFPQIAGLITPVFAAGSIIKKLEDMGIQEGDTVSILDFEFEYVK